MSDCFNPDDYEERDTPTMLKARRIEPLPDIRAFVESLTLPSGGPFFSSERRLIVDFAVQAITAYLEARRPMSADERIDELVAALIEIRAIVESKQV